MPDLNRVSCTRCQQSIYNCIIPGVDGTPQRVPIFTRINCGQAEDTGPLVALDDPNVRMTSFTREFLQTRIARIELCEKCLSEFMGWPLVSPSDDPMFHSTRANANLQKAVNDTFDDPSIDKTERFSHMHTRTLHAARVAWKQATPTDLPDALQPKEGVTATLSDAELAKMGLQRIPSTGITAPITTGS